MPHMCTRCNSIFEDGMDVLEGCPVCGWNKFLFVKSKDKIKEVRGAMKASEIGGPYEPWPEGDDSLRQILNTSPRQDHKTDRPKEGKKDKASRKERRIDKAESKHGFFDIDSPKDRSQNLPGRGSAKLQHEEDRTLESIRMPEPGTYELNLPSLFERDELVMAVKEGTYLIDLSSAFKKSKKD